MRTLIEEHGGAIATAAIVIIIIAAIVALGQTGHLQTVFTALIDTFTQKAQEAANFQRKFIGESEERTVIAVRYPVWSVSALFAEKGCYGY